MHRNLLLLLMAVPFLLSCTNSLMSERLYNKKITGKFNNSNYHFLTNRYPFILKIKGVEKKEEQEKSANVILGYLTGQPSFSSTNLVAEHSYDGPNADEISFVIHLNSPPYKGARNVCDEDVKTFSPEISISEIQFANIGFCRNDKTYSYISAQFIEPTSIDSDEFKNMIRRAANSILNLPTSAYGGNCSGNVSEC